MSTTKLDAEGLAYKRWPVGTYRNARFAYAAAIREVAQPLADELARVKAERDELRSIANHCLGILSVTEPHSEMVARLKEYFDKYLLP